MEGGVALFLLLILVVVAIVAGIAIYLTGGALMLSKDREKKDVREPRPTHESPSSPTQEKVTFAGTEQDDRADRGA